MTNKAKPIFGLDKVPDEVIIKELRTELGKLNAYIQELECYKRAYEALKSALNKAITKEDKKAFLQSFKATELVQGYITKIANLEAKNKALSKDKEKLICDVIELNELINAITI